MSNIDRVDNSRGFGGRSSKEDDKRGDKRREFPGPDYDYSFGGGKDDEIEFVSLSGDNELLRFDVPTEGRVRSNQRFRTETVDIEGVDGTILGIDVRPADGQVYGLSSESDIYTIDPDSGQATQVSTLSQPFDGGVVSGVDFNPVVDLLRIVGDNDQNYAVNVDTGEVSQGGDLAFPDGADPSFNPNVTAAAYTNSVGAPTQTTLYDIDPLEDVLLTQNPAQAGTLQIVGDLGVDFDFLGGFDIVASVPERGGDIDNFAYAVSDSKLYSIDLESGEASRLGQLSGKGSDFFGTDPNQLGLTALIDAQGPPAGLTA